MSRVEVAPCLLPKISGVEVTPSVTSVESSEQFWRICEHCCNHRCATEISFGLCYSRTQVTRTLKGNEKQFELARNSNYLDQGKKQFELAGNSSHLCSSYQGSTTVLPQAVSYKLKQCI